MTAILELASQRKKEKASRERGTVTIGRYTVRYTEGFADDDLFSDIRMPAWTACCWVSADYSGTRYFRGETREEVEQQVADYLSPITIDLRSADKKSPVTVPFCGEVTLIFPASKRQLAAILVVTSGWAVSHLKNRGYTVGV